MVQTRTWGLLIDLVAQIGHYKPNATGLADFVVEGEKHYDAILLRQGYVATRDFGISRGIAIDRFDGTIVGQQLEEVTE